MRPEHYDDYLTNFDCGVRTESYTPTQTHHRLSRAKSHTYQGERLRQVCLIVHVLCNLDLARWILECAMIVRFSRWPSPSSVHLVGGASMSLVDGSHGSSRGSPHDLRRSPRAIHRGEPPLLANNPPAPQRRYIHHVEMTKLCPDAKTALSLSGLKSGDTIAVGGFGLGGTPETLLNELASREDGPTDLTVASLTAGVDDFGLGRLFEAGKVKRMISSYVGENKNFEHMFFTGQLEVELVPQVGGAMPCF